MTEEEDLREVEVTVKPASSELDELRDDDINNGYVYAGDGVYL